MAITLSLLLIFAMLIICILKSIPILYPLTGGLVILSLIAFTRGFRGKEILALILKGILQTSQLYILLILVGASTALWLACGTVPAFIYYGVKITDPQFFIISVFLTTGAISSVIGSSFGTVGTIGIVYMTMAKAGQINPDLIAGTIISAAYLGERISPLSSSANLIAILTATNLYLNLKRMFLAAILPFGVTLVIYLFLSVMNPLNIDFFAAGAELRNFYNLHPAVLLPAVIILILVGLKIDVRIALVVSIVIAFAEGLLLQTKSAGELVRFMFFGFEADFPGHISGFLRGGGILSIINSLLVVAVSSAYAGIFAGTNFLASFANVAEKISEKLGLFFATVIASIAGSCFGCSQTFAIITTYQFMHNVYAANNISRSDLALDIGNTALIIAPLIPWNIGATFPAAVLSVGSGYIPYAFFLYLVPLSIMIFYYGSWTGLAGVKYLRH